MPVRMKDIARDLGVSVVTVSKVLRNHSDISEETRARVLRRIKELNYRPNLAARALVTGRTYTVGLIVPDLVHPFFAEVAKGLSRVLRKKGYSVVISSSEEDVELEQQEIEQLVARRVDALFLALGQTSPEALQRVVEQQIPYVLLDRTIPGVDANFVGVDDQEAGRLAVEHLAEQGCRRIAHIRGPEVSTAVGRLEGYRRALAGRGVDAPASYVVRGTHGDDAADLSGYESMRQLLRASPRPDAVFCYNDPMAMGAMKAILEAGLDVPGDIAVVGCGNVTYAGLLRIPLSSIDQSSAAIGERAARLALSLIESKTDPKPKSILLTPTLVVRDSSRKRR
jgi:LacI family transcriptional regulator